MIGRLGAGLATYVGRRGAALAALGSTYVALGFAMILRPPTDGPDTYMQAAWIGSQVTTWAGWPAISPLAPWGALWVTVGAAAIIRAPSRSAATWTWTAVSGLSWLWASMILWSWWIQRDLIPHGWTLVSIFGTFGMLATILASLPDDRPPLAPGADDGGP